MQEIFNEALSDEEFQELYPGFEKPGVVVNTETSLGKQLKVVPEDEHEPDICTPMNER